MLAVVTNLPGWRVASPESDLEKAPDADWPLYPTTLPVLPVMFGPNISGQETSKWGLINATFSGALYPVKSSANHIGEGGGNSVYVFGIDASRSSSLYGKSATAQPESLRLLPCIKF